MSIVTSAMNNLAQDVTGLSNNGETVRGEIESLLVF